jgi:hypothetical protein
MLLVGDVDASVTPGCDPRRAIVWGMADAKPVLDKRSTGCVRPVRTCFG